MKILLQLVTVVAFVWRHRAEVVEAAGAVCLVVAATLLAPAFGWAAAGVVLIAKSIAMAKAVRS